MGAWSQPELPEGPLRDLNRELHRLHARSGYRSSYQIAAWLAARAERDPEILDGWKSPSHTSVHKVLIRPVLPNRGITIDVVEALIALGKLPDGRAVLDRVEELWATAFDALDAVQTSAPDPVSEPLAAAPARTRRRRNGRPIPAPLGAIPKNWKRKYDSPAAVSAHAVAPQDRRKDQREPQDEAVTERQWPQAEPIEPVSLAPQDPPAPDDADSRQLEWDELTQLLDEAQQEKPLYAQLADCWNPYEGPSEQRTVAELIGKINRERIQFTGMPAVETTSWLIQPTAGEPPLTLFTGKEMHLLKPGTEIDRFGLGRGNLTYAAGTPFPERSLPPHWKKRDYCLYRVEEPIDVLTGRAIPWFGQPGGGRMYLLPRTINTLLNSGRLSEIRSTGDAYYSPLRDRRASALGNL